MTAGAQASPGKSQPAVASTFATNHSALSVMNKLEGTGVEGKPSVPTGPAQSAEPPPPTAPPGSTAVPPTQFSTQHQQPQQSQLQQLSPVQQQQTQPQQQQQSPPQQPSPQQQPLPPTPPQQQVPVLPVQQELKPASVLADAAKPRTEAPKPEFKVATPPRNSKRIREAKVAAELFCFVW